MAVNVTIIIELSWTLKHNKLSIFVSEFTKLLTWTKYKLIEHYSILKVDKLAFCAEIFHGVRMTLLCSSVTTISGQLMSWSAGARSARALGQNWPLRVPPDGIIKCREIRFLGRTLSFREISIVWSCLARWIWFVFQKRHPFLIIC